MYFCISASLFPAKKSVTVFDTVAVAVSGNTMASRLIFISFANNATVSNRGLLRPSSISMMVRTLMCRLSASALWVRCRFARAARDCTYTFSVNDNTLTLTGGEGTIGGTYELHRQEE